MNKILGLVISIVFLFCASPLLGADNKAEKKENSESPKKCETGKQCPPVEKKPLPKTDKYFLDRFYDFNSTPGGSLEKSFDGGHTVLNGGDNVLNDIKLFRQIMIEKIQKLKPECFSSYEFTRQELISYLKKFRVQIIDQNSPAKVFINESNFITDEIIVNGQRRTAANSKTNLTVFIDRNLWNVELRKNLLLVHEIFGLMGLEKTDEHELSTDFLFSVSAGQCASQTKIKSPRGVNRGCRQRQINFSAYRLDFVSYDRALHTFSFFDSNDQCFYFWDAKNSQRLRAFDLEINFKFKKFLIHDGHLIILVNDDLAYSFAYNDLKLELSLENNISHYQQQIKDIFVVADSLLFTLRDFDQFYSLDLNPMLHIPKEKSDPVIQVLPLYETESFASSLHSDPPRALGEPDWLAPHYLIRKSGKIESLYFSKPKGKLVTHGEFVYQLPQSSLKQNSYELLLNFSFLSESQKLFFLNGDAPQSLGKSLVKAQASGYNHFITVSDLDPEDPSEYLKMYEKLGDQVFDIYNQVKVHTIDLEQRHIETTSLAVSSSRFDWVYYDSRAKFYFLVGKTRENNLDSLNFMRVENGKKLFFCGFDKSLCNYSDQLEP